MQLAVEVRIHVEHAQRDEAPKEGSPLEPALGWACAAEGRGYREVGCQAGQSPGGGCGQQELGAGWRRSVCFCAVNKGSSCPAASL